MRDHKLWSLLLLCALALVLGGCALVDWYPEGKDCRSKGCADGYECRMVDSGYFPQYACMPATPKPPAPVEPGTPPTTEPPKPPATQQGCSIDGAPGAELPGHVAEHGAAVNAAIAKVTGQEGGRIVVQEGRQAFQAKVIAAVREAGLCAGQHTPTTDEIAVATSPTAPREGWHVYAGPDAGPGTALLSPQAYRGAYSAPQTTPSEGQTEPGQPAPAPETSSAPISLDCPAPLPMRAWFFRCAKWGGEGATITDCSVKAQGQPDFCEAVWGKRDLNCDLGPEASEARACRERYLYGTTRVESKDGAECWQYGDNQMQVQGTRRGSCRLCSTSTPVVCSEWF